MTCSTMVILAQVVTMPLAQKVLGHWFVMGIPQVQLDPPLLTHYLVSTGDGHMIHQAFSSSIVQCTRLTELSSSRLKSSAQFVLASWS